MRLNSAIPNSLLRSRLLIKKGLRNALYFTGDDLKKTAVDRILDRSKKTGRVYKLKRRGRIINHQASAPWESPANLSGDLRRTIDFELKGHDSLIFGAGNGPKNVKYARDLEFGGKTVRPRPYLRPSIVSKLKDIENYLKNCVKKEFLK